MENLLDAIKSNNIKKVKDLLVTNRQAFNELPICDVVKFVNDAEMFGTLFMVRDEEVSEYYEKILWKILHNVIRFGKDLKMIEAIINMDKNCINQTDEWGLTPLHRTVQCEREINLIRFLLENKADVNICSKYGYSPLHLTRNLETAKLLIENGAKVNCVDSYGCTPIMTAIRDRRGREIILEFIKIGADVTVRDQNGKTCLHLALNFKYDEGVINQIYSKALDRNVEDKSGLTPLCYALVDVSSLRLRLYRAYFIQKMINEGFSMNTTVFMHAVQICPDVELIACLAKYVDIRCVDKDGNSVLHHAQDPRVISMLARTGAPVKHENNKGMIPLAHVINYSQSFTIERIESLLFWDSDIRTLDVMFNFDKRQKFKIHREVLDLFILYGMSVSVKRESMRSYLSDFFRYMVEDRAYILNYGLLRHMFLSNENIIVPDVLKDDDLIKTYKRELDKMKCELLIRNVTFYHFCMKLYKSISSPFGDRGFRKSHYNEIKRLFPIFYNEMVVKIRINIRIDRRKVLLRKLMRIYLGKQREKENEDSSCECVALDCDSMDILGSYMNERDIKCLLTASIID